MAPPWLSLAVWHIHCTPTVTAEPYPLQKTSVERNDMTAPSLLVVDDDRANCAVISQVLTGMGYTVDVANDGPSALELVEQNDYDLALLDYQMPGMDGVELFQRIRELRPDMLGVFLTAYTRIDTVFSAIDAGAFRVLSKPVDFNELVPILEELVGKPV